MVSSASGSSNASGAISFGGLASGIDTKTIIEALMQAEQVPIAEAQKRLADQQQRSAALSSISASISNLQATVTSMSDTSAVNARVATTNSSSVPPKLNVSATSGATLGSFTVDVLSLATYTTASSPTAMGTAVTQNVKLADAGFTVPVTTGTFSINGVTITIDDNTKLSDGVDAVGANTILAKINDAGVGVTASIVNDGSGRANLLSLTSGATIQLGSGGDTSNFLAAANLLQSPGTTTRTSTRPMVGTSVTATLDNSRLSTAIATASGQFTINGVAIAWDRSTDSINQVIARINSSTAGVSASYDTLNDKLILTSKKTGSATISMSDDSGNFLAATGLLGATPTLGQNASYSINGGATQYSSSNAVDDAVPGVSLNLVDTTTGPITVTVSPDNSLLSNRISQFVNAYNSALSTIATATKYGGDGGTNGVLFGDPVMQRIQQQLRSMISNPALGISGDMNTLTSIGLNFGKVGSAVGTTTTLALDSTKFATAMLNNPEGVARLLSTFRASASLDPGGQGSIASISGYPTLAKTPGKYTIASDVGGATTVTFTPDDGSAVIVSSGTLVANSANTTIIPGVTINAKAALVTGTDFITVTATEQGIGLALNSFLGQLTSTTGALTAGNDAVTKSIADINTQISTLTDRMNAKQKQLEAKFNAMEQTISQLKNQQSALEQMQSSLAPKK